MSESHEERRINNLNVIIQSAVKNWGIQTRILLLALAPAVVIAVALSIYFVLALLSDSTNVERPGVTPSERSLGPKLDAVFRRAGQYFVAIVPNQPRAHFNLIGLYRYHIPAALRRTKKSILAVLLALGVASVVAWVWGSQFTLPPGALDFSHFSSQAFDSTAANFLLPSFTWHAVWWNNIRAVLLYFVTAFFSFGSLAIVLIMLPVAPIAFIGALVSNSGLNPLVFLAAFILPPPQILKPGRFTVWVSVGNRTGTPKIALPLANEDGQQARRNDQANQELHRTCQRL